jgi:oligopeptide/dipeptide ABC transporter ATP-binding protein
VTLLEVRALTASHSVRPGVFGAVTARARVVNGVSFTLQRGELLGLVGESGCGKSTLARALALLHPADSGAVLFEGLELRAQPQLRKRLQIVFQDAAASLDPRLTAGAQISEALEIHRLHPGAGRPLRVKALLDALGLASEVADQLPRQLSGGQLQRVCLARALAVEPEVLIADEPLRGLDLSSQARVGNLLLELQRTTGLACLFISHDLRRVAHLAQRIAVMYLGRIVELLPADQLARAHHPYTRALRDAALLTGEVPSPLRAPLGCAFHPRCPQAFARCREEAPALRELRPEQASACHLEP